MRAVMDIGGSCASGGPYVVENPCPDGVAALFPLSIFLGLACVMTSSVAALKVGWPSIAWLGWPALFLSLGWNFWEYGLNPPDGSGIVWSWIICGALFWVMGGGPVVLWFLHPEDRPVTSRPARAAAVGQRVRLATTPPPFRIPGTPEPGPYRNSGPWPAEATTSADDGADDLVTSLERLASLHQQGKLSDEEFEAAKRTLIEGAR